MMLVLVALNLCAVIGMNAGQVHTLGAKTPASTSILISKPSNKNIQLKKLQLKCVRSLNVYERVMQLASTASITSLS